MKKKIFLMALIACLSITNANAGLLKKALFGGGIAALATGAYISTFKHLRENPDEIKPYFEKYPNNFGIMKDILFKESAKPQIETGREQLRRIAEEMGVELPGLPLPPKLPQLTGTPIKQINIKDYVNTTPVAPSIPNGTILSTPIGNVDIGDLREEFPNNNINSWEDYVLLKNASNVRELEKNMRALYGNKPKWYSPHHIVAWNDIRATGSRTLLDNEGIGYNDAENGIYLPQRDSARVVDKQTGIKDDAALHPRIHTDIYHQEIENRLSQFIGDPVGMKQELKNIGNELKNNTFPY